MTDSPPQVWRLGIPDQDWAAGGKSLAGVVEFQAGGVGRKRRDWTAIEMGN